MRYYRWYKKVDSNPNMVEATKDYFNEQDEYINEANGWKKIEDNFIDIEEDEDEQKN